MQRAEGSICQAPETKENAKEGKRLQALASSLEDSEGIALTSSGNSEQTLLPGRDTRQEIRVSEWRRSFLGGR